MNYHETPACSRCTICMLPVAFVSMQHDARVYRTGMFCSMHLKGLLKYPPTLLHLFLFEPLEMYLSHPSHPNV